MEEKQERDIALSPTIYMHLTWNLYASLTSTMPAELTAKVLGVITDNH